MNAAAVFDRSWAGGLRTRAVPGVAVLLLAVLTACSTPASGTFRGTVTDAGGVAQRDCAVGAVAGTDVEGPVPEFAAVTDGRGRFSYRLPPGTYEVTATCDSGSGSSTATLRAGSVTTVDLVVE